MEARRDAYRNVTRGRLVDAARAVFFAMGFAKATMEDIASSAGVRRSTLYNHFSDKDALLDAVTQHYGTALCEVMRRAPGPDPSRAALDAWLDEVVAFVARERTPTILLSGLGDTPDTPFALHAMGDRLLAALGETYPAFRAALEAGPRQRMALARASLLLRDLAWASLHAARSDVGSLAPELMAVVGDAFAQFIRH